jgi:hypothetical protein
MTTYLKRDYAMCSAQWQCRNCLAALLVLTAHKPAPFVALAPMSASLACSHKECALQHLQYIAHCFTALCSLPLCYQAGLARHGSSFAFRDEFRGSGTFGRPSGTGIRALNPVLPPPAPWTETDLSPPSRGSTGPQASPPLMPQHHHSSSGSMQQLALAASQHAPSPHRSPLPSPLFPSSSGSAYGGSSAHGSSSGGGGGANCACCQPLQRSQSMTGDFGGGGAYSASIPYRAAVPGRGEFGSSRGDVLSRGELPRTDWGGSHTSAASSYTSGAGSYMQQHHLQQQQQLQQHQLPSDFDFSGMHSSSGQQQQQQQPPPLQLAATAKAFVPQSPTFRPLARAMSDGGLSLGSRGAFVPHHSSTSSAALTSAYSSSGDAPPQSQWTPATASASDSKTATTAADATAAEGSDGSGGGGDTDTATATAAAIATGDSATDGEGGASPQLSSSSEEAATAAGTETAAAESTAAATTGTGSSDSSGSSSGAAVSGAVDIKRSSTSNSSDSGSAALPSLGAMAAIAFGKAASTTGTSPPSDPLSGELSTYSACHCLYRSCRECAHRSCH